MLNHLTIYDVGEKIRLGRQHDGGYVLPKICVDKSEVLFSYGISNDISFDESYIEYTLQEKNVHGFDHTIQSVQTNYPNIFTLHLEGISGNKKDRTDNFLSHYEKLGIKGKVLLKIDVEGAEFEFFNKTDAELLSKRTTGIVVEFHNLSQSDYQFQFSNILRNLNEYFYLCHAHGNNNDTLFEYNQKGNVFLFPNVIELSFVSKDLVQNVDYSTSLYPSLLDSPNVHGRADIDLNFLTKKRLVKTYSDLKNQFFGVDNEISKFVFRTGKFTLDQLPKEVYAYYEAEMINNPEFILFYFDDYDCRQMIVETGNKDWIYTYDNLIPSAFRADFWRYVVLYIYGGIYLDFSHKAIVPFTKIVKGKNEVFVKDNLDVHGINNSFIACSKGNLVLKEVIRLCVGNVKEKKQGLRLFEITGPQLLEIAFKNTYQSYENTQGLNHKMIQHHSTQQDIGLYIHNENGEKIIKYRDFDSHYFWSYGENNSTKYYANLYSKNIIYSDEKWITIAGMYRNYLLREPDYAGILAYYLSGMNLQDIEHSISNSPEYKLKN